MDCISNEIIFYLCKYLDIEDIMKLRSINKHYNSLLKSENIWKFFLDPIQILFLKFNRFRYGCTIKAY